MPVVRPPVWLRTRKTTRTLARLNLRLVANNAGPNSQWTLANVAVWMSNSNNNRWTNPIQATIKTQPICPDCRWCHLTITWSALDPLAPTVRFGTWWSTTRMPLLLPVRSVLCRPVVLAPVWSKALAKATVLIVAKTSPLVRSPFIASFARCRPPIWFRRRISGSFAIEIRACGFVVRVFFGCNLGSPASTPCGLQWGLHCFVTGLESTSLTATERTFYIRAARRLKITHTYKKTSHQFNKGENHCLRNFLLLS